MTQPNDNSSISLFRSQALVSGDHSYGAVVPWVIPRLERWSILLVALVLCGFLWIAHLPYASKMSVQGHVKTAAQPVTVVAQDKGHIAELMVVQDSNVTVDQNVALINKRIHSATGLTHGQLKVERLETQRLSKLAALTRYENQQRQKSESVRRRKVELKQQISSYGERLQFLVQRTELAYDNWSRSQRLAGQGWLSARDLARVKDAWLMAQDRVLAHQRDELVVKSQYQDLSDQQLIQALEQQDQAARYVDDLHALEFQIRQIQLQEQHVIVSPIAGVVADLFVEGGDSVSPGSVLMTILPTQSPENVGHEIVLLLPSRAAGQVQTGMTVRVRYSGYPYQEFGVGEGKVMRVSEAQAPLSNAPMYQAEVQISTLPDRISKLPDGMSVEADVLLEAKPLWTWLVAPAKALYKRL